MILSNLSAERKAVCPREKMFTLCLLCESLKASSHTENTGRSFVALYVLFANHLALTHPIMQTNPDTESNQLHLILRDTSTHLFSFMQNYQRIHSEDLMCHTAALQQKIIRGTQIKYVM